MNCLAFTYSPNRTLAFLAIIAISFLQSLSAFGSDSIFIKAKSEDDIVEVVFLEEIDHEKWNKLIHKLEKKADLPQAYFVDYLFYKTHQLLLKTYKKHSNFEEMLETGNYDCVSASLAYSLILNHFDIPHSIIETDFHVFLVIRIDSRDYIFESTDPINGFIKDESQVFEYIAGYTPGKKLLTNKNRQDQIAGVDAAEGHINTIYKKINIKQLVGLQYYNQAVFAINLRQFDIAKQRMGQALQLYPSERLQSVFQIISSLEK